MTRQLGLWGASGAGRDAQAAQGAGVPSRRQHGDESGVLGATRSAIALSCDLEGCDEPRADRPNARFCSHVHAARSWDRAHPRRRSPVGNLDDLFETWLATPVGRRLAVEAERRALVLHGQGVRHWGIGAIWESIRFDWTIAGDPDAEFKANNNHRSRLARRIMGQNPTLSGFFELRRLRS